MKIFECFNLLKNVIKNTKKYNTPLKFTPQAWFKINAYINLIGDLEITGLGKIEDNYITDVKIFEQEVKAAYVETEEDTLADFVQAHMKEIHLWQLDWHSHVEMQTSPSGTDWKNYALMQEIRMGSTFPFLVINKSQQMTAGEYIGNSKYHTLNIVKPTQEELDALTEKEMKDIYNQCKQDIELLCTEPIRTTTKYHGAILEYTNNLAYPTRSRCDFCNDVVYTTYEKERGLCMECLKEKNTEEKAMCLFCSQELDEEEQKHGEGYCFNCLVATHEQKRDIPPVIVDSKHRRKTHGPQRNQQLTQRKTRN